MIDPGVTLRIATEIIVDIWRVCSTSHGLKLFSLHCDMNKLKEFDRRACVRNNYGKTFWEEKLSLK